MESEEMETFLFFQLRFVELMTPLMTPIFDFHQVYTTPSMTLSLVEICLKF